MESAEHRGINVVGEVLVSIDWSLIGNDRPVDVFGSFKSGYAFGKGLKDQRDEDSALSSLSSNPSDNNALAKLMRVNPELEGTDRAPQRETRGPSRADTARSALSGFIENSMPEPAGVTGTAPVASAPNARTAGNNGAAREPADER
jgi:hypothetical protein